VVIVYLQYNLCGGRGLINFHCPSSKEGVSKYETKFDFHACHKERHVKIKNGGFAIKILLFLFFLF